MLCKKIVVINLLLPFLEITLKLIQCNTPSSLGRETKKQGSWEALEIADEGLFHRLNSPGPCTGSNSLKDNKSQGGGEGLLEGKGQKGKEGLKGFPLHL